jgi:hypothetical protein
MNTPRGTLPPIGHSPENISQKILVSPRKPSEKKSTIVIASPSTPRRLDSIICSIGLTVFKDPVITKHGYTYERENIMKNLETSNKCPISRNIVLVSDLVTNNALRRYIEYLKKNGFLNENGELIKEMFPVYAPIIDLSLCKSDKMVSVSRPSSALTKVSPRLTLPPIHPFPNQLC